MRVIIQRVSEARVEIGSRISGEIGKGLLILLGIESDDAAEDVEWLCTKIPTMRIFQDEEDKMNKCLHEVGGRILLVSQFTLHASTKKGNRPSFIRAARPEQAIPLYELFIKKLEEATGTEVMCGEFGAMMQVHLVNDGPVTIWMDSKSRE
jgi:D-tyrosyl-tRNA(Tyr) deacylase